MWAYFFLGSTNFVNGQELIDGINSSGIIEEVDTTVYRVVERMPYCVGCDLVEDENLRLVCERIKLDQIVYHNFEIPNADFKNGMQVIGFVVEKDSSLSSIKINRSIGNDLIDERSISLFEKISALKLICPGSYNGEIVRVGFSYPLACISLAEYDFKEVFLDYGDHGESFEENFVGEIRIDGKESTLDDIVELEGHFTIKINRTGWVYRGEDLDIIVTKFK